MLRAGYPLADRQQRGELVPGPGRIPRLPGPAGEVARVIRVCGCSAPRTRSCTGSSAANWSRAPAASPPPRSSAARWPRAVRVRGCSGPRTRSCDWQQRGELVPGPGRVPRLPGPAGEAAPGGQGVRVLRAGYPLADRQQRGELVPGPGRVPRLPGPVGEVVAGHQGLRVLRAEDPLGTGSSAANWSRAPAASPASPVK